MKTAIGRTVAGATAIGVIAFGVAIFAAPAGASGDPSGPPAICLNGGSHTPFPGGDPGSSGGQGNGYGKDCSPAADPTATPTPVDPPAETAPAITVTACAEDATASGGAIAWTGADTADTLYLDGGGIPLITLPNIAASGSYGPLEGGTYKWDVWDNTTEHFSGSFTIARCPVAVTPTPHATPELTPAPVPDTGAGRG